MPCPIHGGKSGQAFRVYADVAETGGGTCNTCPNPSTGKPGFSDGFALLMWVNGWTFPETLREVTAYLGMTGEASVSLRKAPSVIVSPKDPPKVDTKALASLDRVWGESIPLEHPDAKPGQRYLDRRGVLIDPIPAALRFHRGLGYYAEKDGRPVLIATYPAMLALVVNVEGQAVGIHRTFLTPDGEKVDRKLIRSPVPGATTGGAVRLFELGSELAIAEGIETAIAFHRLTGIPTWPALNAGGLERVKLPAGVRNVTIAADHDLNNRGQDAAQALAQRLLAEGREVRIFTPKEPGTDFNDVLGKVARHGS